MRLEEIDLWASQPHGSLDRSGPHVTVNVEFCLVSVCLHGFLFRFSCSLFSLNHVLGGYAKLQINIAHRCEVCESMCAWCPVIDSYSHAIFIPAQGAVENVSNQATLIPMIRRQTPKKCLRKAWLSHIACLVELTMSFIRIFDGTCSFLPADEKSDWEDELLFIIFLQKSPAVNERGNKASKYSQIQFELNQMFNVD